VSRGLSRFAIEELFRGPHHGLRAIASQHPKLLKLSNRAELVGAQIAALREELAHADDDRLASERMVEQLRAQVSNERASAVAAEAGRVKVSAGDMADEGRLQAQACYCLGTCRCCPGLAATRGTNLMSQ